MTKIKFIGNIVDVMRTFFPEAVHGEDYEIADDGLGHMEITTALKLPTETKLRAKSEELAKVEAQDEKKVQRQALVYAIKVTTQSGKTFDGNETAQERMARAIITASITGQTETVWVLADNVPTPVTLAELQEALALSMQEMAAVWAMPYEDAA